MPKRDVPKATNIIFSYVPLLWGEPGKAFLGEEAVAVAENVAAEMDKLPSGSARACLWTLDEDGPAAVFAVDRHEDIAVHLKVWAEGEPGRWFKLHCLEKGPSYAVALIPDLVKSAERWRIAFQLRHGYPPATGSDSLIFRPLHCVAKTKTAFDQVKGQIGGRVRVGLVGAESITPENFQRALEHVSWLGDFPVVVEKPSRRGISSGYLEDQIDDMLKEG